MFKYMIDSIKITMRQSENNLTGFQDWQKAEIVLIGGTLILTILLSSISSILESLSIDLPVTYLLSPSIFGIIVFIGFISGYIAKTQFFQTFKFTLLLILGIIVLLVLSDLFFETRFLGLQTGYDLSSTVFIAISTILVMGFMATFALCVFLLPSLFIGSKISAYRSRDPLIG